MICPDCGSFMERQGRHFLCPICGVKLESFGNGEFGITEISTAEKKIKLNYAGATVITSKKVKNGEVDIGKVKDIKTIEGAVIPMQNGHLTGELGKKWWQRKMKAHKKWRNTHKHKK